MHQAPNFQNKDVSLLGALHRGFRDSCSKFRRHSFEKPTGISLSTRSLSDALSTLTLMDLSGFPKACRQNSQREFPEVPRQRSLQHWQATVTLVCDQFDWGIKQRGMLTDGTFLSLRLSSFAYGPLMCLVDALSHCKQKASCVREKLHVFFCKIKKLPKALVSRQL